MSSEPDAQQTDRADAGADVEESVEPAAPLARARQTLRVPGVLVRLARRDPHHIPERLTLYEADRQAADARVWAQRAREAAPDRSSALLVDSQRRSTISTARIDGAVAGTILHRSGARLHRLFATGGAVSLARGGALRAQPGRPPHRRRLPRPARRPHGHRAGARGTRDRPRQPAPPAGQHTPLRSSYEATVRILILTGFLSAPEEDDETGQLTPWAKVTRVVRFVVAGLIWALTWVVLVAVDLGEVLGHHQ
jgi:hypothetical protein